MSLFYDSRRALKAEVTCGCQGADESCFRTVLSTVTEGRETKLDFDGFYWLLALKYGALCCFCLFNSSQSHDALKQTHTGS
jgi:hypothetical protein